MADLSEMTMLLIGVAFISAGFGWYVRGLAKGLFALKTSDHLIVEHMKHIETLVNGEYVRREEFQGAIERIIQKLDGMSSK